MLSPFHLIHLRDDLIPVGLHIYPEKLRVRLPALGSEKLHKLFVGVQQPDVQVIPDEKLRHKARDIVVGNGLGLLHFDCVVHVHQNGVGDGVALVLIFRDHAVELHPDVSAALDRHPGQQAVFCPARSDCVHHHLLNLFQFLLIVVVRVVAVRPVVEQSLVLLLRIPDQPIIVGVTPNRGKMLV